jgi:hypothetical protein
MMYADMTVERTALIDAVRDFSDVHLAPFANERDAQKVPFSYTHHRPHET